jgi:hypothetical protein
MLIRIALAIDIFLIALCHICPKKIGHVLPIGGDPFVQLAVLLLIAVAIGEAVKSKKSDE